MITPGGMRITRRSYTGKIIKYTLEEAIVSACDGSEYESGELETIKRSLTKTQEMLGKLAGLMNLSAEQVEELLSWGFDVEKST